MSQRRRDVSRFVSSGHHIYENARAFNSHRISPGLSSYWTGQGWFDWAFEEASSDCVLVTFSAAMPATGQTYPMFSGLSIARSLGVEWLGFSDPFYGISSDFGTSWHLGTEKINGTLLIRTVLNKLLGEKKKLIFFGASAGGYAALYYSYLYPSSSVMVLNPRISLTRPPIRFSRYSSVAHPGADPESLVAKLDHDICSLYSIPVGNRVIYIQNTQDPEYFNNHYVPFREAVGDGAGVEYVLGDFGEGHVVPSVDIYLPRLRQLLVRPE